MLETQGLAYLLQDTMYHVLQWLCSPRLYRVAIDTQCPELQIPESLSWSGLWEACMTSQTLQEKTKAAEAPRIAQWEAVQRGWTHATPPGPLP